MYMVIAANAPDLDATPFVEQVRAADRLVAADGGALPLLRLGRAPDIVIGDMDSLDDAALRELAARGAELRRFRRDKDETDLELALLYAAAAGASAIDVIGALGGRWDHTLANVALLALPELAGRRVRLLADGQTLLLVRDTAAIDGQRGDTVSLIPLAGPAHGITTQGLQYPLDDATLGFERARGISNVLLDPPGRVSLRAGLLLLVHHDDGGAHQWRGGA
ncbi:MAG TPA: thiamine diphosphokinase [Kouleothrix sp.]|uniref:thiamine diphosphokinase n=1 Tax=Kouleothrix sp. TaxID=2779161 RepID=UPI002D1B68E3|nr:thiamine diphosphokinase [Kouleothrix sp.]